MEAPYGLITVPGNHDVYALDTLRDYRFERTFGETMSTDLPEYLCPNSHWPFVRLLGDDVAVVAVNSARPNLFWKSSGRVPAPQLEALRKILADPRVIERFVFVITHYGPRLADGRPDTRLHGLVNVEDFLAACADIPHGALLHGHIHRCFTLRIEGIRPPVYCAGSSTMAGHEGLWVFDIDGQAMSARPGRWDGERYVLED